MSEIITSTVEKDDGHGFLKTDAIRLTEIGGGIAHTVTCREGALCVQHCNLIIEVEKLEEVKVFDENGVSPTLQATMGAGGGNVPFVINKESVVIQKCGDRDKEGSYSVHDYSNTIPANPMSDRGQMLVEQTCVAMRGRNPENPSDRTPGIELEQRLEINNTGCTNTLTTVQKDNLVLEKTSFPLRMVRTEEGKALRKDYEAGNIHHGFNEYREPECRTDGVSNTVTTVQKDTLLLEKEQVLAYDEQNQTVRTETFGTLTTDGSSPKHNNRVIKIKQATKQGFIECEIGGGILFGISDKRVETRPSNRERTDKPDSDDGEHP